MLKVLLMPVDTEDGGGVFSVERGKRFWTGVGHLA